VNESSIAGLRPTLSAKRPITSAPIGRAAKPTPKVNSDSISRPKFEWVGKNASPICSVKKV
jgi:hypothetical protein